MPLPGLKSVIPGNGIEKHNPLQNLQLSLCLKSVIPGNGIETLARAFDVLGSGV